MLNVSAGMNDVSGAIILGYVGHHRLDLDFETGRLEIHGGPAPDLSTEDFFRAIFSDIVVTGEAYPSGSYHAGPDMSINRVIADNADVANTHSVVYNAVKDANAYFSNQHYSCFGPNSNTYFQYSMLHVVANLLNLRQKVTSIDLDVSHVYQPGFYSWKEIADGLPVGLTHAGHEYAKTFLGSMTLFRLD